MAVCPKGHESEAIDYCDVCGTLMSAGSTAAAPSPSAVPSTDRAAPTATTCPACQANLTGRFCEECGHDSLAAPPTPSVVATDAPAPAGPAEPAPPPPVDGWWVMVSADREYFERMRAMDGPDAAAVSFPAFCPERRFPLAGRQLLIGRRSSSRGVYPDIDLIGPPEDTAVSHTHALLVPQPDGAWAVIDLRSTNRTYLNGNPDPIETERPVPLVDGATVNLGAWTRLTLRADRRT